VKKPGGAGIDLGDDNDPGSTTNNLIERNKILQSAVDGIYVEDTGNVFRRNIVKKSTGSDLHDITGPEGNTYEDNKFGSEDFS
jgi:parallel beta-helix repeat protein